MSDKQSDRPLKQPSGKLARSNSHGDQYASTVTHCSIHYVNERLTNYRLVLFLSLPLCLLTLSIFFLSRYPCRYLILSCLLFLSETFTLISSSLSHTIVFLNTFPPVILRLFRHLHKIYVYLSNHTTSYLCFFSSTVFFPRCFCFCYL